MIADFRLRIADSNPAIQSAISNQQSAISSEASFRRAILAGYPDRVAQRREPGSPNVLLASGTGATIAPESGVRDGEFLVALDVRAHSADPQPAIGNQSAIRNPRSAIRRCRPRSHRQPRRARVARADVVRGRAPFRQGEREGARVRRRSLRRARARRAPGAVDPEIAARPPRRRLARARPARRGHTPAAAAAVRRAGRRSRRARSHGGVRRPLARRRAARSRAAARRRCARSIATRPSRCWCRAAATCGSSTTRTGRCRRR